MGKVSFILQTPYFWIQISIRSTDQHCHHLCTNNSLQVHSTSKCGGGTSVNEPNTNIKVNSVQHFKQ
jgi:hypothetical protein